MTTNYFNIIIIRFTATKLEENVDDLSDRLLERLNVRYHDRKNTTLVSMVKFFHNPDTMSSDPLYRMPGRDTIVRNSKNLHQRLFIREDHTYTEDPSSTSPPPAPLLALQ